MMRRLATLASTTAAAVVLCGLVGCQKPLFPEGTPRTQFETHDRLRNRWVPREQPDVFGNPRPALRSRLSRQR